MLMHMKYAERMKCADAHEGQISLHIRRILHCEATSYCVSNTSFKPLPLPMVAVNPASGGDGAAADHIRLDVAACGHIAFHAVAAHIAACVDASCHIVAIDTALGADIALDIVAAHIASGLDMSVNRIAAHIAPGLHIALHIVAADGHGAFNVQDRALIAEAELPGGCGGIGDVGMSGVEDHPQGVVIGPGEFGVHREVRRLRLPAKELVQGDAEEVRQKGQQGDVRAALARLPFAHGLIGDAQFQGQALLGQPQLFSVLGNDLGKGHGRFLL